MKYRLSDEIDKFSRRREPDATWQIFASILAEVYGEIIHDDEMLRECYCEVRSRPFDELFLPAIVTKIPQTLLCNIETINIDEWMSNSLKDENEPYNPILIIGNVGSGKSTFIHHFFKIALYKLNLHHWIDSIIIDLREYSPTQEKLKKHIYTKIGIELKRKYKEFQNPDLNLYEKIFSEELLLYEHIYKALGEDELKIKAMDIKKFTDDIEAFVKSCIRYIKSQQKKKIYIILDNVDHHPIEVQKEAFLLSKNLNFYLRSPIILTVRDYTLSTAYRHLELSAFQTRYLNLSHPDLRTLLEKRMKFVLEKRIKTVFYQKFGNKKIKVFLHSGATLDMSIDEIDERLRNILESILTFKIIEILEKLSDRDMRILLDIVRIALSSGYLYPPQRQQKDEKEGWKPRVRYYDFIRAIMKGNNQCYFPDEKATLIVNLFDNGEKDYMGNQLIRYRILKAIDVFGDIVYVSDLIKFMDSMGYEEERTIKILNDFLNRGLAESPYFEGYDINKYEIKFLRITKAGKFYLNELVKEVSYLDEVKFATYIEGKTYHEIKALLEKNRLGNTSREEKVSNNFQATRKFIEYINNEEDSELNRILKLNNKIIEKYEKLGTISDTLLSNFEFTGDKIMKSTFEDDEIKIDKS